MTGVGAVLGWRLDGLLSASTSYASDGERVATTADAVGRSFDIDPTWSGRTRDAAQARVGVQMSRLRRLENTLLDLSVAAGQGHGRLSSVRDRLAGQVRIARSTGFAVGDDGAVAHPDPSRRADSDYLTDRIRGLLDEADIADIAVGMKLKMLTRELDGSNGLVPTPGGAYALADMAAAELASMSPADLTRYWESLSPAQRQSLIAAAPGVVGNLDGIDFADRITANERSIRAALATEVAAGRGGGEKAATLRGLLMPAPDPQHPGRSVQRTFLGFTDVGNGRFIELVGDLSPSSTGVAVLVPGTGTSLATSDDYRRRAAALSRRSGAPVIVYADGELPQSVIDTDLSPTRNTAVDPGPARRMAPRLVGFAAALDAQLAASGTPLATTVIGHSYGGSVVGTAEQLGLRADRVVYASSAGTGVEDRPWNNANPEVKRYSMTPPGDPIHYAQKFGGPVHGGDPDTAPGVIRMDTGLYSDRQLVQGPQSHSGYLDDEGSDAMGNLAAVVAGREPSTYVDRVPDIEVDRDVSRAIGDLLDSALRLVPGR
ncbi:alpha/beta hydrolase [Gordonia aichiensis]|uniref:alpha/beta hydrolase n=1 Tax=Gordonia aichiensis TaxID=36820 RepID=UPI003266E19D